jgi:hypothetical protein
MTDALPCIVCHQPLESVFPEVGNQPNGGLVFRSSGNYGSTVYDPVEVLTGRHQHLQINVCDPCIVAATEAQRVYYSTTPYTPPAQPVLTFWDPDKDDDA